jgi:hypothetical protein
MFDDFVLVAATLKLAYAALAAIGLIALSSWLDQRAKRSFGDSLETMAREPMALAIYYGLRILALAVLVGMLIGCSPAGAGTVIPDRFDREINRAVATYWPDYPSASAWKAQLYQESRLDSAAVSPVGAAGLAQIMPATWSDLTRELRLGQASPHHAIAIDAGAYYMAKLRRAWRADRPADDRQRLAQASYNAGTGNIVEAQRACDGARLWAGIAPCLPQITGADHARETTTYVARIATWRRMIEARL